MGSYCKAFRKRSCRHSKRADNIVLTTDSLSDFVVDYGQGDLFVAMEDIRKVDVKWTSPTQVLKVFQKLVPDLEKVNVRLCTYRRKFLYR